MNVSEELVYKLCRKSFLSLWSYANPRQAPSGKELCDVIVVCEPDILIISVKHSRLPKNGIRCTNVERWKRRAIDASVAQLYGAERSLKTCTHVVKSDGSLGIALPSLDTRRVHRIAIALGSEGSLGMPYGDFGKGFVHVLDESATDILLNELDTITDFVDYLAAKERYLRSGVRLLCEGAEEDLLAVYLHRGRAFPTNCDIAVISNDVWGEFKAKPEYKRKLAADRESYTWDKIIEIFGRDLLQDRLEFSPGLTGTERAIRTMARENRFSRRVLSGLLVEFLRDSTKVRARKATSPSGVVYVFLATPQSYPRKIRVAELGNRCFVARGQAPNATRVVGLATERYNPASSGRSFDLVHLHKPNWTTRDQQRMDEIQRELGYFVSPRITHDHMDEYPVESGA